jgi:hypothetical protein
MSSDSTPCQVFTYVVVMQGRDGRSTMPVTVCARPDEAEHAARVIAWLELTVLGGSTDDPELFE